MNTQTQGASKAINTYEVYCKSFSKIIQCNFAFDAIIEFQKAHPLEEIISLENVDCRPATQPIAAEGKSAGVWVRASERMPELYPVNNSHEFHYRLDSYKVDGFFLHSQCFEYFNPEIAGYTQLELTEFNRIEWLDEYASQPKGAGVKIKDFDINDKSHLVGICQWITQQDEYKSIPVTDVSSIFYHTSPLTFAKLIYKYWLDSSLPSQEGNTN